MNPEPSFDVAAELSRLRYRSRLTQRQIALATGVKAGVITGWLRGTRRPRGDRADRLQLLAGCVDELSRYLPPIEVAAWLTRPPAPGGLTPLELIAAGEERLIVAEIDSLVRARAS